MAMQQTQTLKTSAVLAGLTLSLFAAAAAHAAPIASGWTAVGAAGSSTTADGNVSLAPGLDSYQWIATESDGPMGVGVLPTGAVGNEQTGATLASSNFSVNRGDSLNFYFNYITSDGAGYSDYAWAGLFGSDGEFVQYLFTARTTPEGNTVPGFDLPGLGAGVSLNPSSTPIINGAPSFSALGGDSGSCYAAGCGYTDWIAMDYTFLTSGDYFLKFGVVNALDSAYQSAFAIAGVSINDVPIDNQVPEPGVLSLLGLAMIGLTGLRRRKS